MENIISKAKKILDNISTIPGYTGDEGLIVISISQHLGGVRSVDVKFSTLDKRKTENGTMTREVVKKIPKEHVNSCF